MIKLRDDETARRFWAKIEEKIGAKLPIRCVLPAVEKLDYDPSDHQHPKAKPEDKPD